MTDWKIVFICTGNTCRSPFAAAYLRKLCENRKITGIEVSSAGTNTINGMPASENAKIAATEFGVDLSNHLSVMLSKEIIDSADLVICMTNAHRNAALRISQSGKSAEKFKLLSEFSNEQIPIDISDPFGGNIVVYRNCFLQIKDFIDNLLAYLIEKKLNNRKT